MQDSVVLPCTREKYRRKMRFFMFVVVPQNTRKKQQSGNHEKKNYNLYAKPGDGAVARRLFNRISNS